MTKFIRLTFLVLLVLSSFNKAWAVVSLTIDSNKDSKAKILFVGFGQADAQEILSYIKRNLDSTDLFEVLENTASAKDVQSSQSQVQSSNDGEFSIDAVPDFDKYAKLNINAIVIGQFSYNSAGSLEARIRMWDILDRRQFFGRLYTSSRDNYRKMANVVSDSIFVATTGEKTGHFNSQIVYTAESGPITRRIKKIKITDFDGNNNKTLVEGGDLVLTPVFSSKKDEVFYLRYFRGKPQIFSLDLKTLRDHKLGGFRETTFAAHSNPVDSNLVVLSAIQDGNSDIYEMNISANVATRLTKNPAIDTTPTYSPDGKYIAFSSDRDSGQQIYIMDSKGSSVRRITYGTGSYAKPVWSPDGKTLAFTRIKSGKFFIGTIDINGRGEKLLASGYLVEGARWSPNGRYLIYSKKKSPYGIRSIPRLYITDIITGFEYEIPTPAGEGATDPDWK